MTKVDELRADVIGRAAGDAYYVASVFIPILDELIAAAKAEVEADYQRGYKDGYDQGEKDTRERCARVADAHAAHCIDSVSSDSPSYREWDMARAAADIVARRIRGLK